MEIGKLTVQTRGGTGKGISRQLRNEGFVPGTCYGVGLDKPVNIVVDPKVLKASLDPDKRRNTVIDLTVELDAGPQTFKVMLWDYQIDPIKRVVTHVDLKAIDPDKVVEAEVPVELIGRAPGIINGGQINVARHEITISAKPADLPARFELDISKLDLNDVLHVFDLAIPEGIELLTPLKLTIVTCLAPKAVVEEVAVEGEEVEGEEAAEGEEAKKEGGETKKEGGDA